ncbi:MAG: hypothetical protein ACREQQ_12530 [Candidatus Binatia bacterium]
MKRSISSISLLALLVLSGPAWAIPNDEYDDTQSHPLRVAAYLLHPVGYGLEWVVFRPFHWLVSRESTEKVFGHTPHGAEEARSTTTTTSTTIYSH